MASATDRHGSHGRCAESYTEARSTVQALAQASIPFHSSRTVTRSTIDPWLTLDDDGTGLAREPLTPVPIQRPYGKGSACTVTTPARPSRSSFVPGARLSR
jgi:hypothetical protein